MLNFLDMKEFYQDIRKRILDISLWENTKIVATSCFLHYFRIKIEIFRNNFLKSLILLKNDEVITYFYMKYFLYHHQISFI